MALDAAPYFAEIAHGPEGGAAHWSVAEGGCRVRISYWPVADATGTVLIFPGRTEFIEKYGQIAKALAKRGYASTAIDWRGQGLADRALPNPLVGHVERFVHYQHDVAAMLRSVDELDMPKPLFLLAHSMGGAIGLRALTRGLPVRAAAFSAPMWGIHIEPHLKAAAWFLSLAMPKIGQGHRLPPGSRLEHHVLTDDFESNLLTRDRHQFDIMGDQLRTHPDLTLGGPSFVWLREALLEIKWLARQPSPQVPCVTFLGTDEGIVDVPAIHNRMRRWPNGTLELLPDGKHEVLMESAEVTEPLFQTVADLFAKSAKD